MSFCGKSYLVRKRLNLGIQGFYVTLNPSSHQFLFQKSAAVLGDAAHHISPTSAALPTLCPSRGLLRFDTLHYTAVSAYSLSPFISAGVLLGAILSNFSKVACRDLPLKMMMYSAVSFLLLVKNFKGQPKMWAI